MRKIPGLKELFVKDYIVLIATFIGVLLIGLSIYYYFIQNNMFGIYGLGGSAIGSFIVAILRLFILRKLFANGVEASGQIKRVSFYRQSCRIVFEFDYDAEHIKAVWITVRNQKSRNLKNDSDVKLLVNPNKPKQAIILDLFD